ncbi:hypothetical protein CDL15_Pgr028599 [Punica granatum]|uniref:Uncharacterized protein n=1 Tax=Punica granatum TaxID=22663 RepID=A0A218VYC9_PUNGR|nr:hypothetical protein CDL15_Pgr028599 [Punica granatum]
MLVMLKIRGGKDEPYRLSAFEPISGRFSTLPPIPGFPAGLPKYFELVAVGSELLVLGGWDPVTFYASASDGERMVYAAGGCFKRLGNSLKSAMAYDIKLDEWIIMPDMAKESEYCKGAFQSGKFHVIGGYKTYQNWEESGYMMSEEIFDPVAWS